jgi:sigma-E factor negative regulatory protein RseB
MAATGILPRRLRPWSLFGLALLASGGAWGQAASSVPEAADARGWLVRIQEAAANRNYQGTMVFSAGGAVSSSRVAHFCDGSQRFERVEALDGKARQTLRHNDVVQTVWPQSRLAVIEQRDVLPNFPALPHGDARLLDAYDLRLLGNDRVAGHDAQVLLFKPRDALRFGQRLWAERETGLLLRADTLGPQGEVLESSAFSDLAIGGKSHGQAVLAAMRQIEGFKVVRSVIGRTQLEAEGWTLARPVPGFRLISCVKRPIDSAAEADAAPHQVLQSVFSDGLTHVSVFIEPFDAARHKSMRTAMGATHTTMSRQGDWWITVMGDVPMATAAQFAAALERRR